MASKRTTSGKRKSVSVTRVGQFSVRIPDGVHDKARAAAKKDGKSLNLWICEAMEERLAGRQRATDPTARLERVERDVAELKRRLS